MSNFDEDEKWIEEGREMVRKYDAGDRSHDVVAYVEFEGVLEQREAWSNLTQAQRDAEESSFKAWLEMKSH